MAARSALALWLSVQLARWPLVRDAIIVGAKGVGKALGNRRIIALLPQGQDDKLTRLGTTDVDEVPALEVTNENRGARTVLDATSVLASSVPRTRWRKRCAAWSVTATSIARLPSGDLVRVRFAELAARASGDRS
jgi:hypothetical protein